MAGDTSASEPNPMVARTAQRFGTVVVVGGGCYGSYYVRQLQRAERAGALSWNRLLVVDRRPDCNVGVLPAEARPTAMRLIVEEWEAFFARFLGHLADHPEDGGADAIVPSPLMPHLMAEWLLRRAADRWPARSVRSAPLGTPPAVPWQRPGADSTHYVSFAEWMCPINCIEPVRCPHTRGTRSWSLPPALIDYVAAERAAGRPIEGPFVFHCVHRAYGVGMLDVRDVLSADRAITDLGSRAAAEFLVGTVSHCHGALRRIVVDG